MTALPVLFLFLLAGCLLFIYRRFLHVYIERFLQYICSFPDIVAGRIIDSFARLSSMNWYTMLMMVFLMILMFNTAIGSDIIEDYLSNLSVYDYRGRFWTLFSLFITQFLLSLSIWIIPFWLYDRKRIAGTIKEKESFYLTTKLKSFLSLVPYGTIGTGFLIHDLSYGQKNIPGIVFFLVVALVFLPLQFLLRKYIMKLKDLLRIRLEIENGYVEIFFWTIAWHILLIISMIPVISVHVANPAYYKLSVAFFLFVSSTIVFQLFYYSDDKHMNDAQLRERVLKMFKEPNRSHSRLMYLLLMGTYTGMILYYLFVPSLAGTNSLYILLGVFGFIIIFLDYFRNLYRSGRLWCKALSLAGIMAFVIMPFISPKDQFHIPLEHPVAAPGTLKEKMWERIAYIDHRAGPSAPMYIICGMGGGSRAGYITASVLQKLDERDSLFYDRTLCYSTISGSSPGIYHYLKSRDSGKKRDTEFVRHIYARNYNSSGIFGFLLGDNLEAFFGFLLARPVTLFNAIVPRSYNDRNERIKREYEYALIQSIQGETEIGYRAKTFGRHTAGYQQDYFVDFFSGRAGSRPFHFVNSFEVNSGRRAVFSPLSVDSVSIFTNSVLPLQDTNFHPGKKGSFDMLYRDVVNLSELFPLLSASATIGGEEKMQFVDGGYYENYGLTTALDIYDYLVKTDPKLKSRLKIILIKNSRQEPVNDQKQLQLLAPLVGVMNAPFTGHANHMEQYVKNKISDENFIRIKFDNKRYRVPLTRALTTRQIDSMDAFIRTLDAGEIIR